MCIYGDMYYHHLIMNVYIFVDFFKIYIVLLVEDCTSTFIVPLFVQCMI